MDNNEKFTKMLVDIIATEGGDTEPQSIFRLKQLMAFISEESADIAYKLKKLDPEKAELDLPNLFNEASIIARDIRRFHKELPQF